MPRTKRTDQALIAVEWVPAQGACATHGKWACNQTSCLVPHHVIDLSADTPQPV